MNAVAIRAPHVEPPPSTLRAPRADLFGPIHKAIRGALVGLLAEMGAADLTVPAEAAQVREELTQVLAFAERHRLHEDRTLLPALAGRLQGTLASVSAAHATQPVAVAELEALAGALGAADGREKTLAGRTLYLHFGTFVAELLLHMAEEERVVQPLLERLFSDDELLEVQSQMLASMSVAERMTSARCMLRAVNAPERAALVAATAASSPREVVDALLGIARSELSAADFADLVSRAGL
jgi:hypothetical protein